MVDTAGSGNAGEAGAAAEGGAGGAMGAMGIALKVIGKAIETVVQILSKIANMIIESSPMLKGVLGVIDKMFKLVLMPVGNMIGRLLLPLTIKMANKTVDLLQKYATAGPEKMSEAATEGFGIIVESMVEMMGVIFNQVLPPVLGALGNAIVNGIASIFGAGKKEEETTSGADYSKDLKELMGKTGASGVGAGTVMDQFGYAMITSNKSAGNYAGTLDTTMQSGGAYSGKSINLTFNLNGPIYGDNIDKLITDAVGKTSSKLGSAY